MTIEDRVSRLERAFLIYFGLSTGIALEANTIDQRVILRDQLGRDLEAIREDMLK